MPQSKPFKIAITGNIGSGKSSFCEYLKQFGKQVFSSDDLAQDVLFSLAPLWHKRWGDRVFRNGLVDKEAISEIVFHDAQELKYLNSEIHPRVLKLFAEEERKSDEEVLFFEIPLLFEAHLEAHYDYLVLVTAPRSVVLKRLEQRDPGQLENLKLRLDQQIPDAEKAAKVDLVIDNRHDLPHLKNEAKRLIESIPELVAGKFSLQSK